MKQKILLDPKGNWYKANLHCHCTVSDGSWTAEEVKAEYQKRGYSVIAYTDHGRYVRHNELDDENFLTIGAFEGSVDTPAGLTPNWRNVRPTYHLNFYDTRPEGRDCTALPMPEQAYTVENANRYIKACKDEGFLCCYNHPWWSMQTYEDYIPLQNVDFFEIYNHGCELEGMNGYAPQAYDELLRTGHRLSCFATDDNHDRFPTEDARNDSFGGFTMIQAPELRYDAIISALQNGRTYASMGPLIHGLYMEENRLIIECSPVEKIGLITEGRNGQWALVHPGESLTRAEFPIAGDEGYVRIQIQDAHGRYANTNAYDVKELLSEE